VNFQQCLQVSHRSYSFVELRIVELKVLEVAVSASELATKFLTVVIKLRVNSDKTQVLAGCAAQWILRQR
jgi:hypothetical protein